MLMAGCGGGIENSGIPGPTGLLASDIAKTSFTLHWSAISDPEFDHYTVYKNGGYVTQTSATYHSLTGLSAGTTYRMTVSYTNTNEVESNQSASYYVTTLSASSSAY